MTVLRLVAPVPLRGPLASLSAHSALPLPASPLFSTAIEWVVTLKSAINEYDAYQGILIVVMSLHIIRFGFLIIKTTRFLYLTKQPDEILMSKFHRNCSSVV